MAWRSLQLSIFIIIVSAMSTATIEMGYFPGLVGTPSNLDAERLMEQIDAATGGSSPDGRIPILSDLVDAASWLIAGLGAVGRIIWNSVVTYSFLRWLNCPPEVAAAGQAIAAVFHGLTIIELKTGRSSDP
jgi:hypothetical protein